MEASALTHAQRRGLFARRSPLLKFQGDEALVNLTRGGHQHAFEALVERYQARLLGFCRQMLGSTEDAEDVLQEVFVAAYNAMIADERKIAVRPWLYRIARNRCLNHLRKPSADGQDTMDTHPHMNGVTTLERVQDREEFRNLLEDVSHLPETQRSALLLREIDAMSYEEIAQAMDTTVPGVKSLLVRARIALAESSQARQLSCDEVRVQLAEAIEGLAKLDGAARRHIKGCEGCAEFRGQLRKDSKVLAALFPAGPLLALKGAIIGKLTGLFGGGAGGSAGAGAAGAGAAGAGGTAATGAAVGGAAAAAGGAGAAGAAAAGAGAAVGTKAAAGLATAALLAGGAVEMKKVVSKDSAKPKAVRASVKPPSPPPAPVQPEPEPQPVVVPPIEQPAEEEVAVEPVTDEEEETGGVAPKVRKNRKDEATADADSSTSGSLGTTGTSGTTTTSCDADGDGVADAECPSGTTTTEVDQTAATPDPAAAEIQRAAAERAKQKAKQKRKAKKRKAKAKKRKAKKRKAKKRKAGKKRGAKPNHGGVPAR